jgi:hypothetical protein
VILGYGDGCMKSKEKVKTKIIIFKCYKRIKKVVEELKN